MKFAHSVLIAAGIGFTAATPIAGLLARRRVPDFPQTSSSLLQADGVAQDPVVVIFGI